MRCPPNQKDLKGLQLCLLSLYLFIYQTEKFLSRVKDKFFTSFVMMGMFNSLLGDNHKRELVRKHPIITKVFSIKI